MTLQQSGTFVPEPIPTDGGWAWKVVIGAFITYFFADGWSYSFGAFYPHILEYLGESNGKTALVGALLFGVPFLISPFVCAAVEYLGCRKVAIFGGLIFASSFILSMFANSVNLLCLTVGVIGSTGLSMGYVSSLVIVTFYFDRYRGIATGIAVTGSGLGSFAIPPLVELMITTYGIKGTLLILSAMCLNMVVAGALYRPPPMTTPESNHNIIQTTNLNKDQLAADHESSADRNSTGMVYRSEEQSHESLEESFTLKEAQGDSKSYTGSISMLDEHLTYRQDTEESFWGLLSPALKSMFDYSFFKNWPFVVFCASSFLTYLWSGVPYIYLVHHAMTQNVDEQKAVFLLSIIGIARTVGQLLLGFIGDLKLCNTVYLYGICITIFGIAQALLPFCTTMATMSIFSTVFGFFISVTYCLQMMCVVIAVGMSRTTSAFGLLQFIQGLATLLGTPVIGWLFDITGRYDISFYVSGSCIGLSGLMLLVIPRHMIEPEKQKDEENGKNNALDA